MPADAAADVSPELSEWARRIRELHQRTLAEVARVVVGMDKVVHRFLIALLANGHVLLEGVPGVAKTTLAKTLAQLLGLDFHRIQFTPDLLPSDVTGTCIFDRRSNDFVLRKGPLFCQMLLADEVNRAPAKTQSALLEAMQENQTTIEGTTLPLPQPFVVLATQNPVEQEGVYRLPEAQLDRFLMRIEMGYPGTQHEIAMLKLHSRPVSAVQAVFTPQLLQQAQAQVANVYGKDELLTYIVELAEASREHADLALGASPRASLCLLKCARARALLDGRTYFTHEDVQAVALSVLGHRLILRPEAEVEGRTITDVVRDILGSVAVIGC
ncbi:MAG: MoxR family ATPase [Gemmataceae bacterium]|nr:MoxR family ATPase [Gemmataceae bacterium]